ncbi:hypothetical protein RI367_002194 [Sorochytrium milnesiophthora]
MSSVTPLLPNVSTPVLAALLLVSVVGILALRRRPAPAGLASKSRSAAASEKSTDGNMTSDKVFTAEELAQYNNEDPSKPVYVAIKGIVYDVSGNRQMYPYNEGYGVFAGRDASRALALSSTKLEDCTSNYSDLPPAKLQTLEEWESFFKRKYPVVGKTAQA